MRSLDPLLIFTRVFEALGLRYMVSGSVAAIYYGEPRLTNAVDVIVFLTVEDAVRLQQAFPHDRFYCPPLEVIQDAGQSGRRYAQPGAARVRHHPQAPVLPRGRLHEALAGYPGDGQRAGPGLGPPATR
jgi:hypothetical protein